MCIDLNPLHNRDIRFGKKCTKYTLDIGKYSNQLIMLIITVCDIVLKMIIEICKTNTKTNKTKERLS